MRACGQVTVRCHPATVPLVARARWRRIGLLAACVLAVAILLPIGARTAADRWHDDSLWANSLRSLGGLAVPYDFAIFLRAADDVRAGDNPYVDPDSVNESAHAPYAYPPLLAIVLIPATALPDDVSGSSPVAVLVSLFLIACVVATLALLDVRDWRCYPIALLYPPTLENVEYGAIGPVLALLVALAWRYRDRVGAASASLGAAVALKVFLWPLVVWLAATRRWRAAVWAVAVAAALVLGSWAVIGFDGMADYPDLLRRLSDVEAVNSYSAYAMLVTLGLSSTLAHLAVTAAAVGLLVLGWRVARHGADGDRRALTFAMAAGVVLTPILWLHYLVLLVVPIALARPRLSLLWLAPLAMTVFELLDLYRGWPRGDGWALLSVAAVVTFVFATALLRPRRRLAAWL
jgi:Glycosyltransferase family 87